MTTFTRVLGMSPKLVKSAAIVLALALTCLFGDLADSDVSFSKVTISAAKLKPDLSLSAPEHGVKAQPASSQSLPRLQCAFLDFSREHFARGSKSPLLTISLGEEVARRLRCLVGTVELRI